jgi:DNA-binding transcriptional regulator GbsR (MarR family)
MKSSLKQFRTELSQTVLNFLWSAWSQVGVMGGAAPSQPRIVDPEPLLLLTWECARQDPRMFDEVLDWLARNGRWINVVRLTTILKSDGVCPASLAGAVAAFMAGRDKTPKWRNFAKITRPQLQRPIDPLFQRNGKPMAPIGEEPDETFSQYGWLRSPVRLRGQAQQIPTWTPASLILKCRALFGVNIRADVFACLVARGPATASALARDLGYSQRRVHETLTEMQLAEQFQTRFNGNRKEYFIESTKGWQLLFESTPERAAWFEWRALGRAISGVWKKAFSMKEEDLTPYIFESEMAKAISQSRPDFTAAGLMLSDRATAAEFLEKLKRL